MSSLLKNNSEENARRENAVRIPAVGNFRECGGENESTQQCQHANTVFTQKGGEKYEARKGLYTRQRVCGRMAFEGGARLRLTRQEREIVMDVTCYM